MAFTPDNLVMDIISALEKGNGGQFTFGYRPESGPEESRSPARWECRATLGGGVGRDSRFYATVGRSFEEAVDKLLVAIKGEV